MEPEVTKPTKAIFAGLTALLTGLIAALADNGMTMVEGLVVGLGTLTAVGVVYGIKNNPA